MKWKAKPSNSEHAFTRLEVVMLHIALIMLAGLALPVLAGNKARSEQALCFSNLRQIGHAFQLWANDHGDRNPWLTPRSQGGNYGSPDSRISSAWFQMSWISNELVTPKILVCPSDAGVVGPPRRMATDFSSTNFVGGFLSLPFRDRALSYIIGVHSFYDAPRSILSADRNLSYNGLGAGCFIGDTWYLFHPNSSAVWTNAIHGETGHFLSTDGSVELLSSLGLQSAVDASNQLDVLTHHFVAPN